MKKRKKYNRSEIFRNAWKFKRNACITMSEALRRAWAIAKLSGHVISVTRENLEAVRSSIKRSSIEVKDWFLRKNFNSAEAYAISRSDFTVKRETEKAVLLRAESDFGVKTFWCPKSCVIGL